MAAIQEAGMDDEYIVWVKRTDGCWERHDAPTLALARLVFEAQGAGERQVALTRLVSAAGSPVAGAPTTARETVAVSATNSEPARSAGSPAAGAPAASAEDDATASTRTTTMSSASEDSRRPADVEIRVLDTLKDAFSELDQPTIWRIVRWATEYAKYAKEGK
jgi:hypothetical protein